MNQHRFSLYSLRDQKAGNESQKEVKMLAGLVPSGCLDEGLFCTVLPVSTAAAIPQPGLVIQGLFLWYVSAAFPPVVRPSFVCLL